MVNLYIVFRIVAGDVLSFWRAPVNYSDSDSELTVRQVL